MMAKKPKKPDTQNGVLHDSDKITPRAVAMRRDLAAKITNGRMPPCLIHLNVGEMREVTRIVTNDRFVKLGNCTGMSISQLLGEIQEAQRQYRLDASEEAMAWAAQYADTYCAVEISVPVLEWR